MQSFLAWFIAPAVLLAAGFGLGTLLARATRLPVPPALVVPLGAALAVIVALAGYVIFRDAVVAPLVVALLGAAGVVSSLRGKHGLPRPGVGAGVWAATYGLYMAPVVLSGHWTWAGYNFVNDTSVQLLLTAWLPAHGRVPPPQPFVSTTLDALRGYLYGGYPLGSHALLAALHALVPVPLEALYQPFVAAFAGFGAMALTVLARTVVAARWAAFAAFTAVTSNLLFQYAQQGNMKEVVTAALLATTAAVAAWTLRALRHAAPAARTRAVVGAAVLLAVPVGAVVDVLSTAGAPYAALTVALWIALLLARRLVPGRRAFAGALGAGLAVLVATTVVTFSKLIAFGRATSTTYASAATATDLGHLVQPLQVRQTAGIWLIGDYRFAPTGLDATATTIGVWLVVALALVAAVWFLVRRRPAVLLFSLPVILIMLVVTPRVSPYADAKTYMLMAPGVTLLGALGAAVLAGVRRWLGIGLAVLVLGGTLWSDALAYHNVHLAPTARMAAIKDLDHRFAGQGPILFNEPEEFAKNFMTHTRLNVGAEAVTPAQTQLRVPQAAAYLWFDLDDLTLAYVEHFPLLVVRHSPANSRPPANFHLVYGNRYYEVWRRAARPRVLEHLPLQAVHRPALRPKCADVAALARRTRRGQELLAARTPPVVQLDTALARRTVGWVTHPYRPDMVLTNTPGEAHGTVRIPRGGRYRAWIAGSFGRAITGWLDGRPIGSAQGVDNIGQWHDIGSVRVTRGRHQLRLTRPSGDLSPGDGFAGELGPLALRGTAPERLVRVRPGQARSRLCGRSWDWIERVAR